MQCTEGKRVFLIKPTVKRRHKDHMGLEKHIEYCLLVDFISCSDYR